MSDTGNPVSFPEITVSKDLDIRRRYEQTTAAEWGDMEDEYFTKPWFAWDVEPDRFYGRTDKFDNVVVDPELYEIAITGKGVRLTAPLGESQDYQSLEEVLGEENIAADVTDDVGDDDGRIHLDQLTGPMDVLQMHLVAEQNGKPVFAPEYTRPYLENTPGWRVDGDVQELAGAAGEWISCNTQVLEAERGREGLVEAAKVLDGKTTIGTVDPEVAQEVNDRNDGSLAYHTPGMVVQRLTRENS